LLLASQENLAANPSHYSSVKHLGAGAVSWLQENGGAMLYYHPYATLAGHSVKYGVISNRHLHQDLREWSTLYTSGRLQKPCLLVEEDEDVRVLLRGNLRAALGAALLLLPEKFRREDLFETITALSYSGDPRFAYGMESGNKIKNIVGANPEERDDSYIPLYRICTVSPAPRAFVLR